jgi:hypothetical protein
MDVAESVDIFCAEALRLMRERRYAKAESLLERWCEAAPAELEPWSLLGLCLVAQGKAARLLAVVDLRQRRTGDGLKLFYTCLMRATEEVDHAAVLRVIEATPRDNLLFLVALFVAGVIAASDGDGERAITLIKVAGAQARAFAEHFARDPYLRWLLTEPELLEDSQGVGLAEATEWAAFFSVLAGLSPTATFHGGAAAEVGEKFIFFAACDERYLDRFGEMTTRALDATGAQTIFHVHVVDPTPALGAKIERLRASCSSLDLRYSSERVALDWLEGYGRASYYACSRLVRLPEVFARYRRDVFMWDMDTEEVKGLPALVEAMEGHDLGYFEMKNTLPSLICHLAAVYYVRTPASLRLADLTAKCVLAKLVSRRPFWLLDQASLFCASRYLQKQLPDFRINDFHHRPGVDFYKMVRPGGSAKEKQDMRCGTPPAP